MTPHMTPEVEDRCKWAFLVLLALSALIAGIWSMVL